METPGPRLKFIQGGRHLARLMLELQAHNLVARHDWEIVKTVQDGRLTAEVVVTRLIPFPAHWPLVVGDVVNNLRAALDHAIWELVVRQIGLAAAERRRSEISFPVYRDDASFRSAKVLKHLSNEQCAALLREQPFVRNPGNVKCDTLAALHEAWNLDKHRQLHVVQNIAMASQVTTTPDVSDGHVEHLTRALEEGKPAIRFTAPWPGTADDIQIDPDLAFAIAIGGTKRLPIIPLQTGLDGMRARVDDLLDALGFPLPRQAEWVQKVVLARPDHDTVPSE